MCSSQNSERGIRVLVADATAMSCQLLAEGLSRTGQFDATSVTSSDQAWSSLNGQRFDVFLVSPDFGGNHSSGMLVARDASRLHASLGIIVLLDILERQHVIDAFRSGARGIFARTDSFAALCKCILRVHEGQVWATSEQLGFLLEALVEPTPIENSGAISDRPLSKREEEIARLVAEGCSNRQISERLKLSEHTIKNYLFRVFEKLGVSTRVELTLYALKRGNVPRSKLRSSRSGSGNPQYFEKTSG